MTNYRRCMKIILVTLFVFILTFPSCRQMEVDVSPENSISLTGVFTGEMIIWSDAFSATASMILENNSLYVMGNMERAADNWCPAIAVLNTETMDISYKLLPVVEYDTFAVLEEKYLLCACFFDEDSNMNIYQITAVSSQDGAILWESTLSDIGIVSTDFGGKIQLIGKEDSWYIAAENTFVTLSFDGMIQHIEELPGDILGLKKDADGILHVYGRNFHKTVDKNGRLTDAEQMKSGNIYFTAGYDYCYTNENGLYGHSAANENDTEIMNFINSGLVYSQGVRNFVVMSPETVYIYGSDGIGGKIGLWKYTKSDDVELDGIEVIRVTYIEDGRNYIPLASVKFNAAQTRYRVVSNAFTSSDGDIMDSLDKELLSGNIGDIVVTRDFDSLRKYGEKKLFADLYSLMNEELSAEDIFGCVRQACEIDGKLYGLPRDFSLKTYAADSDIKAETWDVEAFIDFSNSMNDGKRALLNMTQNDVYNTLRDSVISECIDLEKHTCSFDSDMFRAFLEYIVSLPKENSADFDWNENYYINGTVALFSSEINSYASYYQMKSVFGEAADAEIIGYPSSEGGAAKFESDTFFSISAKSQVKEGAMSFIRYLLSADCVINEMRGMRSIPSLKTTARAWDKSEGKLYYFFYYDNVGRWSADTKLITSENDGSPGVCIQLTQERIDEVYDFLDNVRVYPYIPTSIMAIVNEDMSAFMNTTKTTEETIKIIQNRVSTYLSEKE